MSANLWKLQIRIYGSTTFASYLRTRLQYSSLSKPASTNADEQAFAEARKWFTKFASSPLTRDIGDVSYSRSSGPGGQNVNKVNSKAQLHVPLAQLLPLIPLVLHEGIKSSRYYAEKTESLVFQADESRKQADNRDSCYRRLNQLLAEVYESTVPGETPEAQKERVKNLKVLENEARLHRKKMHSSKKASRSKSSGD